MQNNISISVILPVYNAELYLSKSVDSILGQTFTDFEFIIINDGSTDRSLGLLEKYAQQDSRIKLISRENRGLISTLNEGLSLAKAPLIARMDADDVAYPDRFILQKQFIDLNPEVVCLGGYFEMIDEAGRALTLLTPPLDDKTIQELALKGHSAIAHPAAMLRLSAVKQAGGYREAFKAAEDLDLWLRLGEIGQLANIPYPILQYRFVSNSISGQNAALQKQSARNACQEAWARKKVDYQFEGGDWRPTHEAKSQFDFFLKFGWWAFNYRQRLTAIVYGLKAIRSLPSNLDGWRLLVCALIKPLPTII
jgi:glycosyltransferase involved in cell wall biosynthesis